MTFAVGEARTVVVGVDNPSPEPYHAVVRLKILAPSGGRIELTNSAAIPALTSDYPVAFHTAPLTQDGTYQVQAESLDATGAVIDTKAATLSIGAPAGAAGSPYVIGGLVGAVLLAVALVGKKI